MGSHGIHFLSIGRLPPDPQWSITAHRHPHHELIVLVSGRMKVNIAGQNISAMAGDLLMYPQGVAHEEHADRIDPVSSYFISLEWDGYQADMPVRVRDVQGRVRQMAAWLFAGRLSSSPTAIVQRGALLTAILAEFESAIGNDEGEQELVLNLRTYMRDRLSMNLSLDQLARASGLSKFHFVRTYKGLTGRTPMADLRVLRLEHARDLILTTDLPLKEIAARSGLGSPYALSRLYRRQFSATPGSLRRRS